MDRAHYSKQFLNVEVKLWDVLDGKVDMGEKLKAIVDFDRELFFRPWLKAIPCATHFILELANPNPNPSERLWLPTFIAWSLTWWLAATLLAFSVPQSLPILRCPLSWEHSWPTKCPHQESDVPGCVLAPWSLALELELDGVADTQADTCQCLLVSAVQHLQVVLSWWPS